MTRDDARDAFQALMRRAKSTTTTTTRGGVRKPSASARKPSTLVPCPMCSRHVSSAVIEAHASACDGKRPRLRDEAGKMPSSEKRRDVREDYRGRRAHTGRTTTGFVAKDDLEGGWIARAGECGARSDGARSDAFAALARGAKLQAKVKLPGHYILENFITEDEERRIVDWLDDDIAAGPWRDSSFNGAHQGKKYGVEPNLLKRCVEPARVPMPKILRDVVVAKFAAAHETLKHFTPNECNAINYRKDLGSVLTPHCDDRQLSSDILVNLSLCSDCTMTYSHEKFASKRVDVRLPRRSLQIQSGSTRYDYMHSIANENLHGNRRVSVTFRESGVLQKSPQTPKWRPNQ